MSKPVPMPLTTIMGLPLTCTRCGRVFTSLRQKQRNAQECAQQKACERRRTMGIRVVCVIAGQYVNAVGDEDVLGRWHIATRAKQGQRYCRLPPSFSGTVQEAMEQVSEFDALVSCVYKEQELNQKQTKKRKGTQPCSIAA